MAITILIFAGYIHLADTEFFNFIQTRFYNPSIINSYEKENATDAELVKEHFFDLQNKFAATLTEPAVCSSFLYNQRAEDI